MVEKKDERPPEDFVLTDEDRARIALARSRPGVPGEVVKRMLEQRKDRDAAE